MKRFSHAVCLRKQPTGRNESIFAFLDDICDPTRTGGSCACNRPGIIASSRVHQDPHWQNQNVGRAGVRPETCDTLERIARQDDPTAEVWKGSDIPISEQGLKILGTPLRHPKLCGKPFGSRCTETTNSAEPHPVARCPVRMVVVLALRIGSCEFSVEGGGPTICCGELGQDPRRKIVAVFYQTPFPLTWLFFFLFFVCKLISCSSIVLFYYSCSYFWFLPDFSINFQLFNLLFCSILFFHFAYLFFPNGKLIFFSFFHSLVSLLLIKMLFLPCFPALTFYIFHRLTFQNVFSTLGQVWPNLVWPNLAKLGFGQTWSWPKLVLAKLGNETWPNLDFAKLGRARRAHVGERCSLVLRPVKWRHLCWTCCTNTVEGDHRYAGLLG